MSRDPHWLNEEIRVPRGAALIVAALGMFTLVNWVLKAVLWILLHIL